MSTEALSRLTRELEVQIQTNVDRIAAALPWSFKTPDTDKFLAKVRGATANSVRQAPAAAQRALAATQSLDVGLARLVEILEDDPSLTQSLLRYANSAFYATAAGESVVSLTQAAHRVGVSGVYNVVLSNMISGMLCRPGPAYQRMADQVHSHMVRTAPLARVLAPAFGVPQDDAFALGLLHDVGKLVLFDVIGAERHKLRRDLQVPPEVVLRTLGQVHEAFGGLAAIRWGLGADVARAIATHHRTGVITELNPMSELLFIAERTEHALSGRRPMAVESWWLEGILSGHPTRVENLLGMYEPIEA